MSKAIITESSLADIADAIRAKLGSNGAYRPGDMAAAIRSIPSGVTPTGTITITENGTVDVTDYATAAVSVPNTYAAGDEGKVVSSGALVGQTSLSVTENGTYDTTLNNSVAINVSGSGGPLYIVKSEDLAAAYSAANVQSKSVGNYVAKTQNNQSAATAGNGYMYRNGYEVGGWKHIAKVKAGDYSKLCVDVSITQYTTGWRQAYLCLCSTLNLQNNGQLPDQIKAVYLAGQEMTAAQINAQTGVTINSTDQYALSRQVVEVDISGITTDFYVGFWNCDMNINVYNIYLV